MCFLFVILCCFLYFVYHIMVNKDEYIYICLTRRRSTILKYFDVDEVLLQLHFNLCFIITVNHHQIHVHSFRLDDPVFI